MSKTWEGRVEVIRDLIDSKDADTLRVHVKELLGVVDDLRSEVESLKRELIQFRDTGSVPLLADGLEDACIGIGSRCGFPDVVVYDTDKCLDIYRSEGMTEEEAAEFFDFNVLGAYVGPTTPIFVTRKTVDEINEDYEEAD